MVRKGISEAEKAEKASKVVADYEKIRKENSKSPYVLALVLSWNYFNQKIKAWTSISPLYCRISSQPMSKVGVPSSVEKGKGAEGKRG